MALRFWLPVMFEPVEQYPLIAVEAERLGFHGVCLADHLAVPVGFGSVHPSGVNPFTADGSFPDTFSTIAAMAALTERLRFLSYAYIVSLRDPFSVAKQVGTVSDLSAGRVRLGVGAGWLAEEFETLGKDFSSRGRRTDEILSILEDFWEDGYAERPEGPFPFAHSAMFPVPRHPIPIWIAGKSDTALRRATRHDGWIGMNYDVDEVVTLVETLAKLREEAGDRRGTFEVLVAANAMPSRTLYEELAGRGVTSTLAAPWAPGDPAMVDMAAKRAAMERFADEILRPLAD